MRTSSPGIDTERNPLLHSITADSNNSDVKKDIKDSYKGPKWFQTFQLVAVCSCWLAASSGIILVNRHIMKELNFAYPIALSTWGLSVSCFVSWLICDVFKAVSTVEGVNTHFFWTRIAPVGAAQGIAVWLSNNLYLLLTVAFIEMARSMLPLVTLLALWMSNVEVPSRMQVMAVSLTGIGCAISAYGEVSLSLLGLICLGSNFAIEAARLVILQFLMQGRSLSAWQSLKLMSFPASMVLGLMCLVLESGTMADNNAGSIVLNHPIQFLAAGTLGLAVNVLSNQIIRMSSATTVKLLAAVRGPMVVLSGVLLFSEVVLPIQLFGYSLALAGFVWYNMVPRAPKPNKDATSNGKA